MSEAAIAILAGMEQTIRDATAGTANRIVWDTANVLRVARLALANDIPPAIAVEVHRRQVMRDIGRPDLIAAPVDGEA